MNILRIQSTLKSYLSFDFSYICVIAGVLFGIFILILGIQKKVKRTRICTRKVIWGVVLWGYIAFLVGVMLLNRQVSEKIQIDYRLFWSYLEYFRTKDKSILVQIFCNVFVFIPWPILFAQVFPRMRKFLWGVGSAFVFSALIETTQLVFKLGMFEFDDMFHNTLGAVIGYGILSLGSVIVGRCRLRKSKE